MRNVSAAEVHRALPFPALVEALAEAHRLPIDDKREHLLMEPGGASENAFILLPAWQRGRSFGVKLVSSFPANLSGTEGLPTVQGVYVLFDGRTGSVRAIADGEAITFRKTAGDSALGAKLLSRQNSTVLTMLGAGALAPYVVEAHLAVRPSLERVLIWNRTAARGQALVATLRDRGIGAEWAGDLEAAIRQADIISAATGSDKPLVRGAWLKSGTHIDLIGGWRLDMREADDAAVAGARVFTDQREGCFKSGDIAGPIAAGLMSETDVLADLFDLCQGRCPGRQGEEEITLYKNIGGGHLDLFTAEAMMAAIAP
ncbi:MAG: ornithine cyclodeaminase family protein [Hyphomicrobiaceae bacterium]